jgi:hypothetical protein
MRDLNLNARPPRLAAATAPASPFSGHNRPGQRPRCDCEGLQFIGRPQPSTAKVALHATTALPHFTLALSHRVRNAIAVECLRISFDRWLAEEGLPNGLLAGIPVPVILVSLLFDAPNFIEQHWIESGGLEAGAHHGVGPL